MRTATAARSTVDKHAARREALADAALHTLGELGYARSSLREIANNSAFSHGVVHYYFQDRLELILHGVRKYKATCVHRYDDVVARSTTADGLVEAFATKIVETIVEDAPMHRLWYDLRAQSMFDEALRDAVGQIDRSLEQMIRRVVGTYAGLAGRVPAMPPAMTYGVIDGLFQRALIAHLYGDATVLEAVPDQVRTLMPRLLTD